MNDSRPQFPTRWIVYFLTIIYVIIFAFISFYALRAPDKPDPEFPTAIVDIVYATLALVAAIGCIKTLAQLKSSASDRNWLKWLHLFAAIGWISLPFQGPPFEREYWLIALGAVSMSALHGTVYWALRRHQQIQG